MTTVWKDEAKAAGLDPSFSPYVEAKETHSAAVFLVDDRAYKLKKPVNLGFLDFSTRGKRLEACRRELALNRRLAPDVYLGISDVRDIDGGLLDHLLVMRRMPAQRRLSHLVDTGADVTVELRELAALLAGFHQRCTRSDRIARHGERDAVWRRWRTNLEEIRPFVGRRIDSGKHSAVQDLVNSYLRGREPLFRDRANSGAILDGHGDLLAEDIFLLPDGPRILDCIDFDDELRYLDRIDDIACLAMDLERLGAPRGAREFLVSYLEASGDRVPESLMHHYTAYRAFMRAKVACLPGAASADPHAPSALLDLALWHLNEGRVRLVVVGGAPGTGKSSTAKALADRLGCGVLSSDRVRKELAGVSPNARSTQPYGSGIYSAAWTERTYGELLARAERHVTMGESVVLDATWADERQRQKARDVAARTATDLCQFRCSVPDWVADERVAGRHDISDANQTIAAEFRTRFDDWPDSVTIDTGQPVQAVVGNILHRVLPWRTISAVARPRMAAD